MQKNQLLFIISLFFLFFLFSCQQTAENITVKGSVKGAPSRLIWLKQPAENAMLTIDSVTTTNKGEFELRLEVETPTFYLLQLDRIIEPIVLLVEPGDRIVLETQTKDFANAYTVKGSPGSALVQQLNYRLNQTVSTIDSLSAIFRASIEEADFPKIKRGLDSIYVAVLEEHHNFTVQFIRENRYSLAAALALYQQYDAERSVLNRREDFKLFQLVDSALYPLYPHNLLVVNLHDNVKKMDEQLRLYDKRNDMYQEGEVIPQVLFPGVNGDTITISSLNKRVVFIDFWGTWCHECVEGNERLKEVYEKYKSKGFEVVQFAVDEDKKRLLDVLAKETIPWIVVSDFLQWNSPLLDSMSINAIPSNYLVDRKGIILKRNLSVDELEGFLKNL